MKTNSSGGTAFVPNGMRRILRSSTSKHVEDSDLMENLAFVQEEDKIIDEEVTSLEDNDAHDDAEVVEDVMVTAALMRSVVDTGGKNGKVSKDAIIDADSPQEDDEKGGRYGLRRRRKASGHELERLETMQSSDEGGLARQPKKPQGPLHPAPAPPAPFVAKAVLPKPPKNPPKKVFHHPGNPVTKANMGHLIPPPMFPPVITSVPNPLAISPVPAATLSPKGASPMLEPNPVDVPCPLPVGSDVGISGESEKKSVTMSEPLVMGPSRQRGFSIDMELGDLNFGVEEATGADADMTTATPDVQMSSGRRERAFSFECFQFDGNDEAAFAPLDDAPVVPQSGSSGHRPRGDSIIFDPSSFQDGGIHEQTALGKTESSKIRRPVVNRKNLLMPPPAPPSATLATKSSQRSKPVGSSSMASTSVSLDLVNKDGRIGIYLPEARRARIARFHAKRAKRIWRKRIKYDCRKKLADSRPRIKGRFVKRSDMD